MFDDIRPYCDAEIPAAMQRIVADKYFPLVCEYLFPGRPVQEIAAALGSCRTVKEFQERFMYDAIYAVVHKTTQGLTVEGMERLDPAKDYLFVSNHRDIMLDAAFFQVLLFDAGRKPSEITFGANLMHGQMVIDVGRSNKMFRVERPTTVSSPRDFLLRSKYLSEYIRYTITEKRESVWIAQRNGRTKDGIDATDQGVIKMFCLSEPTDKIKALADLNIVPVSVSYEWEPCDILKALELYESQYTKYTKKPGEDLNSIITGLLQPKGNVHFELCEPISVAELVAFERLTNNEYHKAVARLLDRRINTAYRLYPNNYIAHDIRFGNTKYQDLYTPQQRQAFIKRMDKLERFDTCDLEQLRDIFLGIYSNPIDNK